MMVKKRARAGRTRPGRLLRRAGSLPPGGGLGPPRRRRRRRRPARPGGAAADPVQRGRGGRVGRPAARRRHPAGGDPRPPGGLGGGHLPTAGARRARLRPDPVVAHLPRLLRTGRRHPRAGPSRLGRAGRPVRRRPLRRKPPTAAHRRIC